MHAILSYITVLKKSKNSNNIGTSWAIYTKIESALSPIKVQLNIKFHQFPLISSWDTVSRQTFSKNGQIVFRTSQKMSIHRKPDAENFRESNTFFLCIQKKVKSRHALKYSLRTSSLYFQSKQISRPLSSLVVIFLKAIFTLMHVITNVNVS